MENRESLDEVENQVHNRLPPEQGCSTSADAPQYIDEEEEESSGSLRRMECKQNLKG
jgi:hypothetical protein